MGEYEKWLKDMGITTDVYSKYNPGEQMGLAQSYTNSLTPNSSFMDKTINFLGSDTMKGVGTLGGLAMSGLGIWNQMNAQDQAKKQWAAENDRANQVMAMNTERYNQWKTDKNRLNSEYGNKII